ncbi:hypothetical protein JWJ90_00845 [Desulfobulbus rhabdoformis]|uniref:hypothetical protein n=1 Tax=Desulfobulbus rhabdoformis TaxID=34032 RepID=UPI00196695A2|nr:hypothetical protein [Desulfobulbus rhabdoformis]MBM9612827.1 hypothetical protein [Desulfobulbus rhabdoformis]
MFYIPLTTTPVGWLVLGLGGYALYKSGKKRGEEEAAAAQITAVPAPVEVHEESAEKEGEQ